MGVVPNLTEEQKRAFRDRMSITHKGKITSEETKRKLSEIQSGRSPLLRKYGISTEEYASQIASGNRWCVFRKHFSPNVSFASKANVCEGCKPEYYRKQDLKKNFGIDQEWYLDKLSGQNRACAICLSSTLKNRKHFMVDHDHTTGATRGLLCAQCNFALSRIETVPDWGIKALAYLARYNGQ